MGVVSHGDGLARLVAALQDHGCTVRGNSAQCPAHEDRAASLSIGQGDGRALLNCHRDCAYDDVLEALGMSAADLHDEPRTQHNGRGFQVVATYAYTDETGAELFYAERRMPKDFRQYRMVNGRKVWTLGIGQPGGVRLVLYRLPRVLEAVKNGETVFVTEGEKDVHAIEAAGGVATCNPMGAGKWRPEYGDVLKGATVIVVADKDPAGYAHAAEVRADLAAKAASVTVVEAAEGKDASDHLAAGHGLAGFRPLAELEGAAVLDEVHAFLCAYVAFPSAAAAVTLWAAHTHLVAAFESTPRLALLSPEKQCGKSRTLELLELVCAGAETLSDASPAYLYRRIGAGEVTILLDEADAIWKRGKSDETAEALRSIVNAGHRRSATVGRVEMNGHAASLTRFRVYAPAAIAGIGNLPDTIMDRAVVVRMRRRAPDERVRDYRERTTRPEGETLRDQLAKWASGVADRVGVPWPKMPPGVADRPADVWEPLLMVADLAGGDWPKRAAEACTAFVTGARDDTETVGTRLLGDIRDAFGDADALWTETILERLHALDEAPWGDWYGKPLDARHLAKLIKPYQAKSRDVRHDGLVRKGYYRADLRDAWNRYASAGSATSATSATPLASHVADVADVAAVADHPQTCTMCGEPLDPALAEHGETVHPCCDPDQTARTADETAPETR